MYYLCGFLTPTMRNKSVRRRKRIIITRLESNIFQSKSRVISPRKSNSSKLIIFVPQETIFLSFNLCPDRRPVEGVGDVEEEEEGAEKTVQDDTQQNTLQHHINTLGPNFQVLPSVERNNIETCQV